KEMNRASAVNDFQKNRNPFIDYPCLAEYIWGNKKGEVVDFSHLMSTANPNYLSNDDKSGCSCEITEPTITSPRKNATVNVGAANLNEELTATINVQGVLLTQNVSLAISGTNASLFKVSKTSLTAAQVLNGVDVVVIYKPTALGQHSATLTLSSGELAASTVVTLTGSCLATLTSPTTQGVSFSGSDATVTQQQDVMIKGTNLAGNVSLTLSGTDAAKFTLTKSSLTAAEVNAGQVIILKYKPEAIKAHTATLTVSSNDFASVVVPITGECTFQALEATNVGLSGFTANWTNAGVANYELDVYTKEVVGTKLDTVLLEKPLSAAKITANTHLTSSGSTYDDNGSFRLGTGSGDGVLKITGLDLSAGASLTINAKAYGSDASQLKVAIGTNVLQTITLTSAFVDYTLPVTASATDVIELSQAVTGKRINIAGLTITTGGQVMTKKSLVGYPQTLGAVSSHNVVVPMSESLPYYYTVTPTAVNQSGEIEVLYGSTSGNVDVNQDLGVVWLNGDGQIHILNLPESSQVRIFDMMGRLCNQRTNCRFEERFDVPSKGVYMIQILSEGTYYTVKTLIF
ncbi:MAG TPA: T9SS type A sorting domain-containing protein, partial [Paludibacteraceae bacterium]|nr:T9SS type A sorting domain-containing protein [Paludibacteraceae bacterium]